MPNLSRSAHKAPEYARRNFYTWLLVFFEAAAVLMILFLLALIPAKVNGSSMSPTLLDGEVLLVDRVSMYVRMPQRGEIVTFAHPQTGEELIKRVIGMPGETVEITGGHVYVNGRLLDESSYLNSGAPADFPATVVPWESVFVLGDDRAASTDSRDPAVGCVALHSIDGTVRLRVSPLTRASLFL